ncbi:MAG: cytochrome c biogenesis protein CcdA [Candidatus Thalassarchaeaceae archaeon]|jgi:cytochrome c-type biogenesis protein|nr:cytochrome c biogenesis protein CcdA [Candidatus Thalassarchaeaceae archaeon]
MVSQISEDVEEGMFTAVGDPGEPDLVETIVENKEGAPVVEEWKPSLRYRIQQRTGCDVGVFSEKQTWIAFCISVVMFTFIAWAGLSVFGFSTALLNEAGEPEQVPDVVFETLNRTGVESDITNETGWFQLSEHRGKVVIFDMMARDCGSCHYVQGHLEDEMGYWDEKANESGRELVIIAYGAWYYESISYLNESDGVYHVPHYPTGFGSDTAAIVNVTTDERADPVRLFTPKGTGQIPVVMVIDHEGWIVAKESTGTPTDNWKSFDSAVETALNGTQDEIEELREFGLAEEDTSMMGIIFLGLMLSILVYFSPCAFPVLPGFISYYLSLGAREDELIESGKLSGRMPNSFVIGSLSGLGMWTFFIFIGLIAMAMGKAFASSGLVHYLALGIAILLFVLGSFMLMGGTAHLMGFIQKWIDRWSTTEADERFTPRRNMYLYGIGYAAASVDCTAAAVLPFVVYLSTIGTGAVTYGLGSLMVGLLVLMILVTGIVGLGRQVAIDFLRRATGTIKLIGSWMMMFAGFMLTIYLTQPDLMAKII